jgi:ceramide glucosyltransferase
MAAHALTACQWVLLTGCVSASLYAMLAAVAMPFFAARRGWGVIAAARASHPLPPFAKVGVSVLKPLCGAEPRLYENLRTFCDQRHGHFQLVLGVSSPDDPAIAVVRRLQAAYPMHGIELAVDTRVHGSNLKVSNLINMAERARHDVIVIADSDIAVEADYLDTVAAPLADPRVGVVTCLYVAQGVGGFWPRVGALFINEWFAPSVRVAHAAGGGRVGFGGPLRFRRDPRLAPRDARAYRRFRRAEKLSRGRLLACRTCARAWASHGTFACDGGHRRHRADFFRLVAA